MPSRPDASPKTTALFYFSGHGLQDVSTAENYALPVDFNGDDRSGTRAISVQDVIDRLTDVTTRRIILLDACRTGDTPSEEALIQPRFSKHVATKGIFSQSGFKAVSVGDRVSSNLAEMKVAANTFIAFATASGQAALDALPSSNGMSPFTAALVKHIDTVDLPLSNLMSRVRQEVLRTTGDRQTTWDQSSLKEPFFFNPGSLLMFTGTLMSLIGFSCCLIMLVTLATAWYQPIWSPQQHRWVPWSESPEIFGTLDLLGIVDLVTNWMRFNSEDVQILAAGGGIYGFVTGSILGFVIGFAIILTESWSGRPVLNRHSQWNQAQV